MIALRAEAVRLGGAAVLHDIDLAVARGTLLAVVGPNGAGKTTLLRALAGLLPRTPARDPRQVAYLPQGARSAWALTVEQVAALGRIPHGDTARAPVERALSACGVLALRHRRIDRISGGQARRAMLARAFATEPEAFLFDEPTADLDPAAQHEVMRLLKDSAEAGRSVVVVVHALDLARRYADRVVVMAGGRIVADAAPDAALPLAAAAFGMGWGTHDAPQLLVP